MTADTVGGVWTYAIDLCRALCEGGARIALATSGAWPTPRQRAEAAAVPRLSLHPSAFRLEWMRDPWADVARAGAWLLDLERETAPDVVHLNGYVHGARPFRAPVLVVGHSCVLSWWEAVRGGAPPREWDRYAREVEAGLRGADAVAAPSRAMAAALQRHYGPLRGIEVVPNGRDPRLFAPRAKEPFVMGVGRVWDEAKGLASLDRVAARLPWPVRIAGEERHPDGGRAETRRAEMLGCLPPEALAECLGRAAIYAHPARYEPFGLSVVEAALSGCALVLSDLPGLREIWGDAAVFVAAGDEEGLGTELAALAGDEPRRRSLGARARERALGLDPAATAASTLDLYRRLPDRHRATVGTEAEGPACAS